MGKRICDIAKKACGCRRAWSDFGFQAGGPKVGHVVVAVGVCAMAARLRARVLDRDWLRRIPARAWLRAGRAATRLAAARAAARDEGLPSRSARCHVGTRTLMLRDLALPLPIGLTK